MDVLIARHLQKIANVLHAPHVTKSQVFVLVPKLPSLLSQPLLPGVNAIAQDVQEIRKLVHARKQITVRIMKNASVEGI